MFDTAQLRFANAQIMNTNNLFDASNKRPLIQGKGSEGKVSRAQMLSVLKVLRILRVLRPLRAINRAKGLKVRLLMSLLLNSYIFIF